MSELQSEILKYVFREVSKREGRQWLGASRGSGPRECHESQLLMALSQWEVPLDEKTHTRLRGIGSIAQLLEFYMLKGVRLDSHMGLWGLVSGRYPLRLRRDIPGPREMLDLQCAGERFVSFLQEDRPVGRFKNRFEFLMHDLEHAHKFFGDPELFRGQLNFFNRLRRVLPAFEEWLDDPLFEKDLNYLMSDMNSHPVHLFKYLKAIVLTAELRRGGEEKLDAFWSGLFERWEMPEAARSAGLRINRPGLETGADQSMIHDFFRNYG